MRIIRAIVSGVQEPEALAEFRDVRCAASEETIREALTGNYRPEHVFALRQALDRAGLVANYNTVPYDPRRPFDPSGLRLGTPAVTTQGMRAPEMAQVASLIHQVLSHREDEGAIAAIRDEVLALCSKFAPYQ